MHTIHSSNNNNYVIFPDIRIESPRASAVNTDFASRPLMLAATSKNVAVRTQPGSDKSRNLGRLAQISCLRFTGKMKR